jgi:hypothetical protein
VVTLGDWALAAASFAITLLWVTLFQRQPRAVAFEA